MKKLICVIGTDFKRSSLKLRDAIFFNNERIQTFLDTLPKSDMMDELVVLATCNRVEIYFTTNTPEKSFDFLINHLTSSYGVPTEKFRRALYEFSGMEAVRHLFEVSAGSKSLVYGEHEILGQIRKAYQRSFENARTKSNLNRLFQQAVYVGKRVRSETEIGKRPVSISSAAIDSLHQYIPSSGQKILIVGAGAMSVRACKHLNKSYQHQLFITNRNEDRGKKLANHFSAGWIPFTSWRDSINSYDAIILATSSPTPVLNKIDMPVENSPVIVDIGAPRNCSDELYKLKYNILSIDSLNVEIEKNKQARMAYHDDVCRIIELEMVEFKRWRTYRDKHLQAQYNSHLKWA